MAHKNIVPRRGARQPLPAARREPLRASVNPRWARWGRRLVRFCGLNGVLAARRGVLPAVVDLPCAGDCAVADFCPKDSLPRWSSSPPPEPILSAAPRGGVAAETTLPVEAGLEARQVLSSVRNPGILSAALRKEVAAESVRDDQRICTKPFRCF